MIKSKKIRISFMNLDEVLLTRAEGMATNGSINIDGASAVRRTCQLNFISDELKPVNYFELYKTKFLLEVDFGSGFKKQGIYLLTSFSSNISTNNYTFNISGKDKMCLLNGEHGGSFPFSIDVGTQEKIEYNFEPLVATFEYEPGKYYYQNEGEYVLDYSPYSTSDKVYYKRLMDSQKEELTIKNIISNVVTVYGKEQKHNIFINDLEIKGLQLLEYRGSDPLYLFRDILTGKITDITIDPKFSVYPQLTDEFNDSYTVTLDSLTDEQFFSTSALKDSDLEEQAIQVTIASSYNKLYVIRIQYGEPIGYRDTDLIYGELTANINENVVSILDKIKNILGNYEYFYDEEGHFIFQKRQDYVSNQFSTISVDGLGMEYASTPLYLYPQIELKNISSIGQNPQFQNIKNDFSIWGTRSGESGSLPIHSRIAIHQKPEQYVTYNNVLWQIVDQNPDSLLMEKESLDNTLAEQVQQGRTTIFNDYLVEVVPDVEDMEDDVKKVKSSYELFYPNFITNLKAQPSDINAKKYHMFLHWVYTICEILDFIKIGGDKIQLEEWELYYANPEPLLKNVFQDLLTKERILSNNFGLTVVNLIETWAKKLGFGKVKYIDENYRNQLIQDLTSMFSQKDIYYPTKEGEAIKTRVFFLRLQSEGKGITGRCPTNNLNAIESFEIPLIHNFIFQQIVSNIGLKYNALGTLCSNTFAKIGLEYNVSDQGSWISGRCLPLSYTYIDSNGAVGNSIQMDIVSQNQEYQTSCQSLKNDYNIGHNNKRKGPIKVSDWREILYQMAKDYYDNGTQPNFWQKINEYNDNQYLSWKTGYEAFYEDILGFWRQLYFDPLYESLDYELPIGYNLGDYVDYNGWHKDVYENPSGLNFWIDFIEPQGELAAYAIDEIGVKGKYENSSTVKSIATKNPPALKVLTNMEWELLGENPDPNYTYIQLEGILANSYTQSTQGISALERTQNLLFNHTYLQESITLSIIPDENLTVNSRVKLDLVNVSGEFTISKITLPLAYNGMMSVTLTKIPPTLTTEILIKEFE